MEDELTWGKVKSKEEKDESVKVELEEIVCSEVKKEVIKHRTDSDIISSNRLEFIIFSEIMGSRDNTPVLYRKTEC